MKRRDSDYPAEALHADVVGVGAAGRPVDDAVPQLVIGRVPRHPAEQLAPILHQDCGGGRDTRSTLPKHPHPMAVIQEAGSASPQPLTAAVFGNPAHIRGQPVDVEVLPIEVGALLIPEILLQL